MEPQLRFCNAADGTRIGYSTLGEGPPLVLVYSWGNNPESEGRNPAVRAAYERLAEGRQVISVTRRGSGASQREVEDLSLEAQTSDLIAVVDALGLERFDLWGFSDANGACVAYSVSNPERVSRLVLWGAFVRGADFMREGVVKSLVELARQNWRMARRAMADVAFPTGPIDDQLWLASQWEESITPEMAGRYLEFMCELDVSGYLPRLEVPTLVIARRGGRDVPANQGRAAAALIPNARFVTIEGDISYAWLGDTSYIAMVHAFLDEGRPALSTPGPDAPVQTILFTDIEGHTAMMSRLGDVRGRELLREHERVTRAALATHGGQEVKTMGDGFMASFPSAQRAVECAVALQRATSSIPAGDYGLPEGVQVRAGLNAGEPIVEDADLFGSSVIAASRIAGRAHGGQILVSDVVRQLVVGKGFSFRDLGEQDLRGLAEPVRLWELSWEST